MSPQKKLLNIFLFWRISLFAIVFLVSLFLPYRPNAGFTSFSYFSADTWIKNPVLQSWANFDGVHYLLIASRSYNNEARFFPVYPLSIRYTTFLIGVTPHSLHADFFFLIMGLVISNVVFGGAVLLFYHLLRKDFSEKISFWSCLFLIFFPTSFFFVSVYAESLLLLFSCLALLCGRHKKWLPAALFAALASGTRIVGVFLFPALIVEYFLMAGINFADLQKNFFGQIKKIKKDILWLLLAPLGLILFAIFNVWKWEKWDTFVEEQAALGNDRSVGMLVDPVRVMVRYARLLSAVSIHQYEWWIALLELASFGVGVTLLYFAWRQKIRLSYLVFALGCFFLPVLSGTLSGLPRYMLTAFPIFIALGSIQSQKIRFFLLGIFSLLAAMLLVLFSRGYYVA
jgi:hypothetical protein